MKMTELHDKVIAVARKTPVDDRVPYGFEQRIMACILAGLRPDPWVAWGRALWGAALPCIAIMTLCSIYALSSPTAQNPDDFSREFELAVFANAGAEEVDGDAW